jgi:uncharacterized membrane protein YsdA (DUF1294 family)
LQTVAGSRLKRLGKDQTAAIQRPEWTTHWVFLTPRKKNHYKVLTEDFREAQHKANILNSILWWITAVPVSEGEVGAFQSESIARKKIRKRESFVIFFKYIYLGGN